MNKAPKSRIDELKKQINKLDFEYYEKAESIFSDYEYDKLFAELCELEQKFPEFITPDSPTQKIFGESISEFKQVEHSLQMLSLSNTYNFEDVKNFDERIQKGLENENFSYCAELKFDGVSISIKYLNGNFHQAITRGNGNVGDDVTQNIKTIKNLPLKVNSVTVDGIELKNFEVRGEIYINNSDFLKINEKKTEENEKTYANARNLAAGSIKLLDAKEVAKRPLNVVLYYLYSNEIKLKTQAENIKILQKLGFFTSLDVKNYTVKQNNFTANNFNEKENATVGKTSNFEGNNSTVSASTVRVCENIDELFNFINEWRQKRFDLDFQTDGIVIKINELRQQDYLGNVGRSPRWAFAYKFEPEIAETLLKNITLQVGRTGAITPVAELEPVLLAGSTISRATLHNSDFISQLDLRIGDTVSIEKGGDVIPKVTKVILSKRLANSTSYEFPKICICELKNPISRLEGEANHYCDHPNCPWQIRRRIEHFASKNAMNIAGLGEKVVDKLVTVGFLKNIADIYELQNHRDELQTIAGWGIKSIDKLLLAIEQSKNQAFHNFLFAIGIRFVGEKIAKILARNFASINDLKVATVANLLAINDIGEKIATSIFNFFRNENELEILEQILSKNLNLSSENMNLSNNFLMNKTFVFTGELKSMTRADAVRKIEEFGGKESKSVSKNTTYLVVGENPGSKHSKALSLNIAVLNELEFLELFAEIVK